jgi:hypothetical protein
MATSMTVCFQFKGEKVCVRVPYAIIRDWGLPPEHDALKQIRDWIRYPGPDVYPGPDTKGWQTDVPILATIDRLVSQLSNGPRNRLARAVENAIEDTARDLPPGMTLEGPEARAVQ